MATGRSFYPASGLPDRTDLGIYESSQFAVLAIARLQFISTGCRKSEKWNLMC
jgi:hypothetical protein